ncbi:hypothetical protein Dimus_003943, partial [Dionaea muscipula]
PVATEKEESAALEKGRKTRSKGKKAAEEKSVQEQMLSSLQLPPSILPIDPTAPSSTKPQPPRGSQSRLIMPHHSVLMSTNVDKHYKKIGYYRRQDSVGTW